MQKDHHCKNMFRGFRLVVSVTAALPINAHDGEAVYNFRGSLSTGHFLGQLFRTLNQVLNPSSEEDDSGQARSSDNQITEDRQVSLNLISRDNDDGDGSVEPRNTCGNQSNKTKESASEKDEEKSKLALSHQGSNDEKDEINKKDDALSISDEEKAMKCLDRAQPTCQNKSQGK